ncbi:Peptide-N4-(N-acetyl-beta-glucosaminyl)asparagine amidase A [Ranunculus cassubicifolius]
MDSSPLLLFLISLILLHKPISTNANLHKNKDLFRSQLLSQTPLPETPPTTYFEVTKPIKLPQTTPCSVHVLEHDFAYTYNKPPVLADYKPPTQCKSQKFEKIVLEWKATCKGRQFDRIFGVWLGGVELLRSCSAEPRATGIEWTVEKDITRYASLLRKPETLAVYLGNLIDSTYTGVYHVNVTIHFYPAEEQSKINVANSKNLDFGYDSPADLVLPISRNLPLNEGLWFNVQNSTDVQLKEFSIPKNAYRAVLEVYVSPQQNDEFWFGNPPNEYIKANNLSGTPGNGPFREVVVSLDDNVVGAVFPFTVIYTGGVNPLLWRPITAIGSFDVPTYDIEITPFLGNILDGKQHKIGFGVTNALNVWYIDANLHVWLDSKSVETKGKLMEYKSSPLNASLASNFTGMNGTFLTSASRSIYSSGWVESSYGKVKTHSFQHYNFANWMKFGKDGNLQIVNQTIGSNLTVYSNHPSFTRTAKHYQSFPFYMYSDNVDQGNNSYTSIANISQGFIEKRIFGQTGLGRFGSSLKNVQNGQGSILVKGSLVSSGLGSTQQVYQYAGTDGCYFRNVSSSNYTVLYDNSGDVCTKKKSHGSGSFKFGKWRRPFLARRESLATDSYAIDKGF